MTPTPRERPLAELARSEAAGGARADRRRGGQHLATTLTVWYGPPLALIVFIAWVSVQTKVPVSDFTRDPTAVLQASPFVGLLSNLGVLLWCTATAVCLFCAAVLRCQSLREEAPRFFLAAGLLTLLLLVDDLFRLHDFILPTYGGLAQEAFYLSYGGLAGLYLIRFRVVLLKTDFPLLVAALGLLGSSVLLDVLPETLLPWHFLVEDGLKLLGIVGWAGYWASTGLQAVRSAFTTLARLPAIPASD